MFDTVLVPTDGSEPAETAVEYGTPYEEIRSGSYRTERNNSVKITASRRCHIEYVISDGLRRDASASC
jgi:nucleotide-binding universal stress UspA family protein